MSATYEEWMSQAEAKLREAMLASLERGDYQALKEDATIAAAVFGRRRQRISQVADLHPHDFDAGE